MKRIVPYSFTLFFLIFGGSFLFQKSFGQKITSFSPATGPVGTLVTLTGTGFGATPAANTVFFGSVKAQVTEASATQLKVVVPFGTTYQPISVLAGGLTGFSPRPFIPTFGCGEVFSGSTLATKTDYYAGTFSSPIGIAVGDLNGDGKPDLVTTAQDANGIVIFENTTSHSTIQSGSFGIGFAMPTGPGPTGIAIADLNNDGRPDIIATNYYGSTISIFQNISTGGALSSLSFAEKVDFATSSSPSSDSAGTLAIATGDLDGDGKIDLAVANYIKSSVGVFRNVISGGTITSSSFSRFDLVNTGSFLAPNVANPSNIAIADIDLDSRPELIFNNVQGINLAIIRNISTPGTLTAASFGARVTFGTAIGTGSIAVGDLNNDNKPEIVVTNPYTANTVSVFRNNSVSGQITSTTLAARVDYATSAYPANIAIADITGDGQPDMIVGSRDLTSAEATNTSPLNIFRNTVSASGSAFNSGSFASPVTYTPGGSGGTVGVADLDEDGKADIVVPNYYSNFISVLKNNSSTYTGLANATVTGSSSICNDGVWKNIADPLNPARIVASVKDNGTTLGTVTGDVYVDAGPSTYSGHRYLQRHYVIKPATQPGQNIQLRLYFTDAEFNALRAVDNSIVTLADLAILKYQGPTEDGILDPTDATSITMIPSSSIFFGTAFGSRYAEITVNSLSEFWIQSGAFALPVDMVAFTASQVGKTVKLEWKVANEVNLEQYGVERSTDGVNFSAIGTVAATGAKNYGFSDVSPLIGSNYYRIRQKDRDGKVKYSEIRQASFDASGDLKLVIAPNPVIDKALISLPLSKGVTSFELFNIQGVKVRSHSYTSGGSQTIQVNFERGELPAGTYLYRVSNGSRVQLNGKLVIR